MAEKHPTAQVFTPTTAASLTFVEREQPNNRLVRALQTPGMQIVVYGRSGCGKTTLLDNKLKQTYERHVTSQCITGTTLDDLLLDAFDKIAPFFIETVEQSKTKSLSATLEGTLKAVRLALERKTEVTDAQVAKRALPPQLTPQLLAKCLGEVNSCWVLEDFHKVAETEKVKLAQLMKLFMDTAREYPTVRIIAIGAVATARQVVQADAEMTNRLAQIEVPLMSKDELDAIMSKGEELLNINIPERIKQTIHHCSNGLPAICHQLCLNLCQDAEIVETCDTTHAFTQDDLLASIQDWVAASKDTLEFQYDKAVRATKIRQFDNRRIIVDALGALPPEGGTHHQILVEIRKTHRKYPAGNLTNYLRELESDARGAIISRDKTSDRCFFTSPMMHAFVRAITHQKKGHRAEFVEPSYKIIFETLIKDLDVTYIKPFDFDLDITVTGGHPPVAANMATADVPPPQPPTDKKQ
jgi:hypothetical protein